MKIFEHIIYNDLILILLKQDRQNMEAKSIQITTDRAIEFVADKQLFSTSNPLLLMVSGGSDSTALAYIAKQIREVGIIKNIAALHVNHKIRGKESDDDQEFVRGLCNFLEIPLFEAEIDIPKIVENTKENLEACARRERYVFANDALVSLCQHSNATFEKGRIVTAHTLDDRVENFYMRSIVGTGPGGFRSMKHKSKNVVRPLLDLTRSQLQDFINDLHRNKLAYANLKGELWREDSTNKDEKGFRSFVRHSIIPKIKLKNPNHAKTLCKTMDLIADEDDMLDEMARELLKNCATLYVEENRAVITPDFAEAKLPLKRRAVFILLNAMVPEDVRIENSSVEAVLMPFSDNECHHEKTKNIQCNLIVSSNKNGVIIEPCESYRQKHKKM